MLIPALFVAHAVKRMSVAGGCNIDVIVFSPRDDVHASHRRWADQHDIIICHELDTSRLEGIKYLQRRFSTSAVARLLVPEHLADRYKKILHLDADLVIHNDVSPLFGLAMSDFTLAAVPAGRISAGTPADQWQWWQSHFKALGMTVPYRYFNAGVMLIDTRNWVRKDLTKRAVDFIRRNETICHFLDEDALNALLDGDLLEISPVWNFRRSEGFEWRDLIQPVIVHYAGPLKPWIRFGKNRRIRRTEAYDLYDTFVRKSPWPNWLRENWSFRDFLASLRCEAKYCVKRGLNSQSQVKGGNLVLAAAREYYMESSFADVDQGLVIKDAGCLRLPKACSPDESSQGRLVFQS